MPTFAFPCPKLKKLSAVYSQVHCLPVHLSTLQAFRLTRKDSQSVSPVIIFNHYSPLSFAYDAPKIWNEPADDVLSATSIASFRKKLKAYLFCQAYP